jgi:hypothetical protein
MSNLHRGHSIDASYQVSVVAMFVNQQILSWQVTSHLVILYAVETDSQIYSLAKDITKLFVMKERLQN